MVATAPQPAPKLFREPAKTEPVQCPACGGPITLKGFGAIEQVSCPYCGSELRPADGGALDVLQHYQRAQQPSALSLYTRGTFEGHPWELIGIVWRECEVDGVIYPWQEFLLFNPYRGYRWLVFQMSDGHWSMGDPLPGAPRARLKGHKTLEFKRQSYKHFQSSQAKVTYVEGEFPWQVRVGDQAIVHDYIAPPAGISVEQQTTEEGGTDVSFTRMRHLDGAEVFRAFGRKDKPPATHGVGALEPNRWVRSGRSHKFIVPVLLVVWVVLSAIYAQGRDRTIVFQNTQMGLEPVSESIQIGTPDETTTLKFEFSATGLSNAWAYVDVMLIAESSEEALGFGATAESWSGTTGGEAWSEGQPRQTVTLGGVEGGTYLLQITPQAGGATAGQPIHPGVVLSVTMTQDVVLTRYIVLPLGIIILFPLLNFMFSRLFEGRRWLNSDYAPSTE